MGLYEQPMSLLLNFSLCLLAFISRDTNKLRVEP